VSFPRELNQLCHYFAGFTKLAFASSLLLAALIQGNSTHTSPEVGKETTQAALPATSF